MRLAGVILKLGFVLCYILYDHGILKKPLKNKPDNIILLFIIVLPPMHAKLCMYVGTHVSNTVSHHPIRRTYITAEDMAQ